MTEAVAAPDLHPDLVDVLRTQIARGVEVQIGAPRQYVDPCSACPDDVDRTEAPADAVAYVVHRSRRHYFAGLDITMPGTTTVESPVCTGCLHADVTWELRHAESVWVLVPAVTASAS